MKIIENINESTRLLKRFPTQVEPELPSHVQSRLGSIFGESISATDAVLQIIDAVQANGDAAIRDFTLRIDGIELGDLEVPKEQLASSVKNISADLLNALSIASSRISIFHEACMPNDWFDPETGFGITNKPIERVGLYVPGGTATYPSTVLMAAIPARIAGVKEIVLCTPNPTDVVLAAASKAGVNRVFKIGGAQAIAAMAFGTECIPRVDKICGPGNIFVAIAKRHVFGSVAIDGLYGPTETLIIADDSVDPKVVASDLLAQAEHDDLASPILITLTKDTAEKVNTEIALQVEKLERRAIIANALENQGGIHVVSDISSAIQLANSYAPEHLSLLVREPQIYISSVHNAGGIFVGENSPEVLGDYVIGPSHVMPTGATARFSSNLGIQTYLKQIPIMNLTSSVTKQIADSAVKLAQVEGLSAHAASALMRQKNSKQ